MKNINEIFEAASFISQELIIKADFFSGGVFAFKNQVKKKVFVLAVPLIVIVVMVYVMR